MREKYVEHYVLQSPMEDITPSSSTFDKCRPQVEQYWRLKILTDQLLQCALAYTTPDGRYDWTAFGMSTSGDPWVDEQDMRLHLSAIGLSLSAGLQVIP